MAAGGAERVLVTLLQLTSIMVPTWSLAAKGGIGHQAVKNHRRKSTDGISVPFFVVGIIAYAWFTFYGILVRSYPVIAAQLPGIILDAVIIGQIIHYRKKAPVPDGDPIKETEKIQ